MSAESPVSATANVDSTRGERRATRIDRLIQLTGAMSTKKLIVITGFALLARVIWVLLSDNRSMGAWSDEGGGIAQNLILGKGYIFDYGPNPSFRSFRVPVLPLILYGLWSVFGFNLIVAKLFFAAVSSANVILVAMLGKRLFGESGGVIAALLAAAFPNFVFWTGTLGPETLTMTFLLSTALLLLSERFLAAGVSAGLLILTRAIFLPYAGLLAAWAFLRKPNATGVKNALALAACVSLVMAPWVFRNWMVHDRLLLLSTEGGLVFYECNNAAALAEGGDWSHDYFYYSPELVEKSRQMSEVDFNQFLYRSGIEHIRSQPGAFASAFFLRIFQLWRPFPRDGYSLAFKAIFFCSWFPLFLLALWQIVSIKAWRQWDHWPLLLSFLWVTFSGGITYSVLRYRAPVEPFVIVYAAGGINQILSIIRRGSQAKGLRARAA